MPEPIIRTEELTALRGAASALRDIYDRGYVDYRPDIRLTAGLIEDFVDIYYGCFEAPERD